MLDDWTWTVGAIVAPFGLRGEMKVRIETDFPDRFGSTRQVCLRLGEKAVLFGVSGVRMHKGQALLTLAGISSIDEVDGWRGALVQVRRADAVPLEADEFYIPDLVGHQVRLADGTPVGTVDDVLRYPAQDLLVVGSALIPMVRPIIVSVDMTDKVITIDPPTGLLPG